VVASRHYDRHGDTIYKRATEVRRRETRRTVPKRISNLERGRVITAIFMFIVTAIGVIFGWHR